jgi:hypothetical protein
MFNKKFFNNLGKKTRDRYRNHIFNDAKDVFGTKFKGYSTEYGIRKRSGGMKRQASRFAKTTAPILTSDLMRDFTLVKAMEDGFQIGWLVFGARINHLAKMGRVLTSKIQPLPQNVIEFIDEEIHKEIGKEIKKQTGGKKTTHYGK